MKDLENKLHDSKAFIDAIKVICEKIDCYDDLEEVYSYLKSKCEELLTLEADVDKTVEETKKAHEKEIKEKIKAHVDDHKAKKAGKEPAAPKP